MRETPENRHRGLIYRAFSRFIEEHLPCTNPARTVLVRRRAPHRDARL